MVWLIDNIVEAVSLFARVGGNDPVSPLLLLSAVAILVVSVGVFGVLAIGGLADWITPDRHRA